MRYEVLQFRASLPAEESLPRVTFDCSQQEHNLNGSRYRRCAATSSPPFLASLYERPSIFHIGSIRVMNIVLKWPVVKQVYKECRDQIVRLVAVVMFYLWRIPTTCSFPWLYIIISCVGLGA